MPRLRLYSDVGAKMSMFDQRAKQHEQRQMINPFSDWSGAGTRRKLSRDDPEYGKPVEGSKTAERGRLAQMQMIGDMVELCDMIYDCGIRSKDGRAAISFGDAFRLYSSINDKVVGLLMRGRKHQILDFDGEMLFQGRDDATMIELLLPLNTIRFKYGMPERAGCGEVREDLLAALAEQQKQQQQQRQQQRRTRSVGGPEPPLAGAKHQKSRSIDDSWVASAGLRGRPEARGSALLQCPATGKERSRSAEPASASAAEGSLSGARPRDRLECCSPYASDREESPMPQIPPCVPEEGPAEGATAAPEPSVLLPECCADPPHEGDAAAPAVDRVYQKEDERWTEDAGYVSNSTEDDVILSAGEEGRPGRSGGGDTSGPHLDSPCREIVIHVPVIQQAVGQVESTSHPLPVARTERAKAEPSEPSDPTPPTEGADAEPSEPSDPTPPTEGADDMSKFIRDALCALNVESNGTEASQ